MSYLIFLILSNFQKTYWNLLAWPKDKQKSHKIDDSGDKGKQINTEYETNVTISNIQQIYIEKHKQKQRNWRQKLKNANLEECKRKQAVEKARVRKQTTETSILKTPG